MYSADGREDAFYLVRLWHHYFRTKCDTDCLPSELAEIAGWHDEEETFLKALCDVEGPEYRRTSADRFLIDGDRRIQRSGPVAPQRGCVTFGAGRKYAKI